MASANNAIMAYMRYATIHDINSLTENEEFFSVHSIEDILEVQMASALGNSR